LGKNCHGVFSGVLSRYAPCLSLPLCQNGLMQCFVLYKNISRRRRRRLYGQQRFASLEFVATIREWDGRVVTRRMWKSDWSSFINGAGSLRFGQLTLWQEASMNPLVFRVITMRYNHG
jgi:hypothetical protein